MDIEIAYAKATDFKKLCKYIKVILKVNLNLEDEHSFRAA
jgi:hypothetical protein